MPLDPENTRFLKRLGAKVRSYRVKQQWTLEATEEQGWISWRHLQRIESGKNVNVLTLRRICKLYGITLSDLFSGL